MSYVASHDATGIKKIHIKGWEGKVSTRYDDDSYIKFTFPSEAKVKDIDRSYHDGTLTIQAKFSSPGHSSQDVLEVCLPRGSGITISKWS